jgi:hypothetical protein
MFYNQQCWFMFIYIYICISVYCLYIVYKYLGMTPSGTTVALLLLYIFYFFYFPYISLFYSFVCSSHLCILSYLYIPYGAFFINHDFEFEFVLILIIFHLIIIIRCKQCNIIILAGNRGWLLYTYSLKLILIHD